MKEFQASRLSDGNKVMPNTIKIDNFGVSLKIPGVFSGKEKTLTYHQISSVQIDSPMVGFSTITFDTIGWDRIIAKGFSKEDAHEVKELVQLGIQSSRSSSGQSNQTSGGNNLSEVLAASEAAKAQAEVEKQKIALEEEKIRKEEEAKDAAARLIKANKLREQNKPFLAWFTELHPVYSTSIIVFSIAICFTPIYIIGVTIILILCVFAAKDLIQFSKKILFISLVSVIILPISTVLIIRSMKKAKNIEAYEKLTKEIDEISKNNTDELSDAKKINLKLESIETDLIVAINDNNKQKALELVKKLNHSKHIFWSSKEVYFDEFWDNKREEYRQQIMELSGADLLENNDEINQEATINELETIEYYKINDPDGYSNLRKEPKGDIIKKVYDTELFEVLSEENDHKKIKLKDGTIGYLHKSRVIKN